MSTVETDRDVIYTIIFMLTARTEQIICPAACRWWGHLPAYSQQQTADNNITSESHKLTNTC